MESSLGKQVFKIMCILEILKRLFTFIILIILLPLFLLVALLILIEDGFPFIYKAKRSGLNNSSFIILKFRTMFNGSDSLAQTTAKNDTRVTRIGKILRKYKIDELPQLINVLKGDMNFIGPRPELHRYTNQYEGEYKEIYSVKPGLVDNWALEYSNFNEIIPQDNTDKYFESVLLDKKNNSRLNYVKNKTIHGDLKILLKTLIKLVKGNNDCK